MSDIDTRLPADLSDERMGLGVPADGADTVMSSLIIRMQLAQLADRIVSLVEMPVETLGRRIWANEFISRIPLLTSHAVRRDCWVCTLLRRMIVLLTNSFSYFPV